MGSMSASDAAPLPRLGEVFFDVRGNSRSMRLSWYADTGVAVFSIWQGGTCTGTFRLPIDDLARMIEALRAGPQGQNPHREPARGQVPGEQAYGRDAGPARITGPAGPGGGFDPGPSTAAMRPPSPADPRIPASRADAGYHDEPDRYRDEPADYRDDPGFPAVYPGGPPLGDYRDAPVVSGYPDEASGDYRSVGPAGYWDDPQTGEYNTVSPAGYRDEPAEYPGEPPLRGYRDRPATDYRGAGDYRDDAADGYGDDSPGYRAEPLPAAYPGEPPFRDYPHEPVIGDYHGEPPEHDLAPAPGAGGYDRPGGDWEDTDGGSLGGYSEEPSPESFPYGRPPGKRRSGERGRYPGRH
jgi:hypothetical protein